MSYFNALAGAPENYSAWLIDSNLDWGQGLRPLARWIEKNPEWADARVAYWGAVPPRFESAFVGLKTPWDPLPPPRSEQRFWFPSAGAETTPWPDWPGEQSGDAATYAPQPGKYIVSANYFRGHLHPLATPSEWLPGQPHSPAQLLSGKLGSIRMQNAPPGCFAWLQHFPPKVEREVGPSLLFFDISKDQADKVRAEMYPPTAPGAPKNSVGAPP